MQIFFLLHTSKKVRFLSFKIPEETDATHLMPAFDLDKSEKASDVFFPVGKALQLLQLVLDFTPEVRSATV